MCWRRKRRSTWPGIWRYLRRQANLALADHVESVIRNRIAFLAQSPRAGHRRRDLTDEDVRFFRFIRT